MGQSDSGMRTKQDITVENVWYDNTEKYSSNIILCFSICL